MEVVLGVVCECVMQAKFAHTIAEALMQDLPLNQHGLTILTITARLAKGTLRIHFFPPPKMLGL